MKYGQPFADSYLWGARLVEGRLWPHTVHAWRKLEQSAGVGVVLSELGYTLQRPDPFPGNPPRMSIRDVHSERFSAESPRRRSRPGAEDW